MGVSRHLHRGSGVGGALADVTQERIVIWLHLWRRQAMERPPVIKDEQPGGSQRMCSVVGRHSITTIRHELAVKGGEVVYERSLGFGGAGWEQVAI